MSTHFRPLPPRSPPPPSPMRPSTAHSTIRAVTPSPPCSTNQTFRPALPLSRPKSEHTLGSAELARYARYVVRAEDGSVGDTPLKSSTEVLGLKSRGSGDGWMNLGMGKRGSSSPRKDGREKERPITMREGLALCAHSPAKEDEEMAGQLGLEKGVVTPAQLLVAEEEVDDSDDDDSKYGEEDEDKCPDTPTPMTREQKRRAYIPLGAPLRPIPNTPAPTPTSALPSPPTDTTTLPDAPQHPVPPIPRKTIPVRPAQVQNRVSVSAWSKASALSTTSKNSVFSTPGRDEMERKKALVERDEGPFARVQSVMDLDEERRRISSGGGGGERRKGKGTGLNVKCGGRRRWIWSLSFALVVSGVLGCKDGGKGGWGGNLEVKFQCTTHSRIFSTSFGAPKLPKDSSNLDSTSETNDRISSTRRYLRIAHQQYNMPTTLAELVRRPLMLNDIVANTQRLSAALPPDDWDVEGPGPLLDRQPSGIFELVGWPTFDGPQNALLMLDTLKPPSTVQNGETDAPHLAEERLAWWQRVLRGVFRCLNRHQNEM
ncbi:hypothetical protein FB567DRAFT_551170 [Paraphoma chrysanthemicola]|uniref:Uncharacterized protein n=1 Tax=Paraphoma chrysanthemicola TaxID=798071 RepID=A0A8K0R353_9PLEO|nr:hypothetical protein FB567DRAFT_551170 [Paraphoma chrysanthemicola]